MIISVATMPPTVSTSADTPDTTTDIFTGPDTRFGTLRAWEFGVIIGVASLIIVAVLLSGAVWMGRMTVKRRRDNRRRGRVQFRKTSSTNTLTTNMHRHLSMKEEIQLMEEENVEAVDSGGESHGSVLVLGAQWNPC